MKNTIIFLGGGIVFITLLVYIPALQNEFVNWDDHKYIAEMQRFQPINFDNIYSAFTGFYVSNWHPLTLLSHAIDYKIWGLNPFWHHLGNNILHGLNTLLVLILVSQLMNIRKNQEEKKQKVFLPASVAALLFAIHPLHVESVAWISERKDLLCAFFFLLSLILYNRYRSSSSKKSVFYVCTLLSFILALLSKPMAVTLPMVLLILDFYPYKLFIVKGSNAKIKGIILEKIPFLALSLLSSILTMSAQAEFNAMGSTRVFPLAERLLNAVHALFFYLVKMFFPFNLAPLYPHPKEISFFNPEYFISVIAITFITLFSLLNYRKNKVYLSAWLYYLITLLPVIGIIQVGGQAAADRYTYLPCIAPFLVAGLACANIFNKGAKIRNVFAGGALFFAFIFLIIVTVKQTGVWRNSLNLWNHEIKILPNSSPFIYNNRGSAFMEVRKYKEAVADFTRAIELGPNYLKFYSNRGNSYMELGNFVAAIYDFSHIVQVDHENEKAYNSRGAAYHMLGNLTNAMRDYNSALEINPNSGRTSYNLALIFEETGNMDKAYLYYKKAARLGIAEASGRLR